jgi:hypothetical protein
VNDEMDRTLKEAGVAYWKVLLPDFREVIEKITKKCSQKANLWAENRT